VGVVDCLLCLASGTSLLIVQQYSASILALLFPWYLFSKAAFPVFFTDGTKIVRGEIQVGIQEMYLEGHITPHILL
jgi:hypothetical protein